MISQFWKTSGYKRRKRQSYLCSVEGERSNDFCKSMLHTRVTYFINRLGQQGVATIIIQIRQVHVSVCPSKFIADLIPSAMVLRGESCKG